MVEPTFVKLFLAKGGKDSKGDVYVHKCPQVQHQMDGIRFLYRALIKKKRGVILNDPSGYGKRVQTALFLSTVLPTLGKPALILCREGKEQRWISHFQKWTQFSDDVAIELTNPFAKKKVLISACYVVAAFARRDWSVLVVDDDLISKDIQKSSLRADMRIWITSSAIKDDLNLFSTFNSWVYPKDKFNAHKYNANKSDLRDVLLKTAMLDAFLEDTVLRREFSEMPFPKAQDPISNNITEASVSKKNKDASGTKIKRSKRKSVDIYNTGATKVKPNKVAKTKNTTEKNTEVFDIGDLDEEKTVRATKNTTLNVARGYEMNDISALNDEDNFAPVKSCKSKWLKILSDSEGSEDERDKMCSPEVDENEARKNNTHLDESEEQSKVLRWDTDTDSENEHESNALQLDLNRDQTTSCKTKLSSSELHKMHDKIKLAEVNNAKDDLENSGSLITNQQNQIDLQENDMNNEIVDKIYPVVNKGNNFSEDLFSTDFTTKTNEIDVNITEVINQPTGSNNSKVKESNDESTKIMEHELKKTDQKLAENANLSIFDIKMKEMEELMLKKYKGSFLDSIF